MAEIYELAIKTESAMPMFPEALLRLRSVMQMTGISRTEIYRRMDAGTFPRPVQIGAQTVAWRQSDIQRWIEALPTRPEKVTSSPAARIALKAKQIRR